MLFICWWCEGCCCERLVVVGVAAVVSVVVSLEKIDGGYVIAESGNKAVICEVLN